MNKAVTGANSICFVCAQYPNVVHPTHQVFVQQLVWQMADRGVRCTVVCPIAVNLYPSMAKLPAVTTERTDNGNTVTVHFPKFISFGQRNIAGFKTAPLTTNLFYKKVYAVWKKLSPMPGIIYGHFLTPAGITASRIGKAFNIPSFAAYGESSPWSIHNYGVPKITRELHNLNGIVSVSSANETDLGKLKIVPMQKIKVFPNGIRTTRFYPRNKQQARAKFGFEQDVFIVAFLGQFNERKGVLRVAHALDGLQGIKAAFAGNGPQKPVSANTIFAGRVNPEDVPEFLSAADVFVLPTLGEGCSNAIIEAMACGLPIISSNLPFNADILNKANSILIDPTDIQQIKDAVIYLRDNLAACISMGKASVELAKALSIETRTANVYNWMQEMSHASLHSAS